MQEAKGVEIVHYARMHQSIERLECMLVGEDFFGDTFFVYRPIEIKNVVAQYGSDFVKERWIVVIGAGDFVCDKSRDMKALEFRYNSSFSATHTTSDANTLHWNYFMTTYLT